MDIYRPYLLRLQRHIHTLPISSLNSWASSTLLPLAVKTIICDMLEVVDMYVCGRRSMLEEGELWQCGVGTCWGSLLGLGSLFLKRINSILMYTLIYP
jgi:hypothetical protein